jgi:hypothetical protein
VGPDGTPPAVQFDAVGELEGSDSLLRELLDRSLGAVTEAGPKPSGSVLRRSAEILNTPLVRRSQGVQAGETLPIARLILLEL